MTARARALDYALLVVGLWLAWVFMFRWAGPEALSPPGATLQRAGEYLTSAQFWPHAAATGIAFAYACVIALVGGLLLGLARMGCCSSSSGACTGSEGGSPGRKPDQGGCGVANARHAAGMRVSIAPSIDVAVEWR
jgi:hypothetical protein